MDSWPTVLPLHLAVDGSDVNQHLLIRRSCAHPPATSALPTVVAALTDSQHPANRPDRPVALHFLNPGVLCNVSCAKYAAVHSTGHCNTWFILTINGGVYEKKNQTQIHRD